MHFLQLHHVHGVDCACCVICKETMQASPGPQELKGACRAGPADAPKAGKESAAALLGAAAASSPAGNPAAEYAGLLGPGLTVREDPAGLELALREGNISGPRSCLA